MKKAVSILLCMTLVLALAVPAYAVDTPMGYDGQTAARERTARIINGPVRLRSSAEINNYNTLCQLDTGTTVIVINENCAFASNYWWSYVHVPGNMDGQQYGYVATNFISW